MLLKKITKKSCRRARHPPKKAPLYHLSVSHYILLKMGSLGHPPFNVLDDARPEDKSLPAFMVSTTRGFLPRADPVVTLPSEFDALESILQRMPVKTASGEAGLLAQYKLGDEVENEFPNLTSAMDLYRDDLPLMNALYRDYSFLASAYLLEPCHHRFIKGEPYGLGRQVLPANISQPIAKCAEVLVSSSLLLHDTLYGVLHHGA